MLFSAQVYPLNQELVYTKLINIFEGFANKGREEQSTLKTEKKELTLVKTFNDLDKSCLSKRRACFIALLDGRVSEEPAYLRNVNALEVIVAKNQDKPYSFLHINATCHDEILKEFNINIDVLPTAIIFVPSKDMYTNLVGTFESESILSFMDRVLKGKLSMQAITKEKFKVFEEKDCSLIKDEISESSSTEDDDIMKEMMEEIKRKEAEAEEKQKIEAESKGKKKGKKKKKSKKKDDL